MPYPTQTSREAIIMMAYTMIEREGIEQLTLAQLAEALAIKAPSLYRHIPNKAALIQAINIHTYEQLFATYAEVLNDATSTPEEQISRILHTHRAFAHAHPKTYTLAFTSASSDERPNDEALAQLVQPLEALMATMSGSATALPALRGALALVHGFVMLEIHQQLRRGGDLSEAFALSVTAYLQGWSGVRQRR